MNLKEVFHDKRIRITARSEQSIPSWGLSHYIKTLSENHLKLLTIQRICQLFAENVVNDKKLFVLEQSAGLFYPETSSIIKRNFVQEKFKILENKESNPDDFWNIIKMHSRPIVCIKNTDNDFYPIVNISPYSDDELHFQHISLHSPAFLDIIAPSGSVIIDLLYASRHDARDAYYQEENNRRAEYEHQHRNIGIAADNLRHIASCYAIINDPRVPDGVKHHANIQLDTLLRRQEELNRQIGLYPDRIDIVG